MCERVVRIALLVGALAGAGSARADYVSVLQSGPISMSTAVAFQNSNVVVGTVSSDLRHNFLDRWSFTLDGSFLVSSIVAALDFRDVDGRAVLFGITDLQVKLVSEPLQGRALVSWVTVSAPQPVPLPATPALFACGILALAFTASRSRRR